MTVMAELLSGFESRTQVLESGHVIIGDESEKNGGQNRGPNPMALLDTSLAT